jgi:TatD DNase family protein
MRGKRNESAYLRHIAEKLAELKQCSLLDVANITTQNSIHIFGV